MIKHKLHAVPSSQPRAVHDQPAWKLAELVADPVDVGTDLVQTIVSRVIEEKIRWLRSPGYRPRKNNADRIIRPTSDPHGQCL